MMKHVGTQEITTPRLLLRRFTLSDAPAMYQNWARDAEVTRWMRWNAHVCVAETKATLRGWLREYAKPDFYVWAIQRLGDGALMGSLGILKSLEDHGPNGYEPGYCVGRAFWGQGYTTEALSAAVRWFFDNTGAKTLYCCHAVENPASGRVLQKTGFVYTHKGSYDKPGGARVPALFYEMRGCLEQ